MTQTNTKTAPPGDAYAHFKQSPEAQEFEQWRQAKARPKPERSEAGGPPGEQ